MKPRNLEEVRKEVEELRDSQGEPIDPKIKDLVIGLRRWGIKTVRSCEGHSEGDYSKEGLPYPYPWVEIDKADIMDIIRILQHWWQGKDRNIPSTGQPRWIIKAYAGVIKIIPEDKKSRTLKEMQEDAVAFGKFLQTLPDDYFTQ